MKTYDFAFKISLLGDEGVGKTSLRKVYMKEGFRHNYMKTIGVEISKFSYEKNGLSSEVVIWDMAGDAEFRNIRQSYMAGISGGVLVIDVTKDINTQTLIWWLEDIVKIPKERPVPVALLANKIDLKEDRKVTETNLEGVVQLLQEILNTSPLKSFETSAKTGEGVKEAFDWLISTIMDIHSKT